MTDNEAKVQIGAEISGVKSGMDQAASAVKQGADQMKSGLSSLTQASQQAQSQIGSHIQNMSGQVKAGLGTVTEIASGASVAFSAVAKASALVGAALAGGAFLKGSVDQFLSMNFAADKLSKTMGTTKQEAAGLINAYNRVGVSTDTVSHALRMLEKNIKTNSDGIVDMGRQVGVEIDLNGDLKSIYFQVVEALGKYETGHQRNQAAMAGFGARVQDVNALLKANAGDAEKSVEHLRSLGLQFDDLSLNKAKEFRGGMHDVNLQFDAMKYKIGEVAIPALTSLGNAAIWVMDRLREMWRGASGHGDSAEAGISALGGYGPGAAPKLTYPAASSSPKSGATYTDPNKGKDAGGGGGTSILQEWKAELEQLKVEQNKYLEFSKEEERKFWQDKLAECRAGSKEYLAVQHEIFTLDKGIARDAYTAKIADLDRQIAGDRTNWDHKKSLMAEEVNLARANYGQKSGEYDRMLKKQQQLDLQYDKWKKDLDARKVEEEAKLALMDLARKEQQIKFEEQMGTISGSTAIQRLNALKNQELMVEQQAINRKKVIRQGDEKEMEKLASQEAEFKKKKLLEMDKAEQTSALKTRQMFSTLLSPISNAISTTINGMIQGTLTLGAAIANLGQSMLASIVGFLAKMLEEWIITWIMAAIFPKVTNAGVIASDAAVAAAAAYASTCAIPVVGPAMAPAAAAMAYGEVMALMPLASAAGGWDIPADTLAYVHKKEMILPEGLAERVRQMTAPAPAPALAGAPGGGPTIIIQAIDSQDVARFVQKHGNTLFSGQFQPQRNSRPLTTFKNINGTGKY